MDGLYEVQPRAFCTNSVTGVKLFHGLSLKRNRQPVVIKRHDLSLGRSKAEFLEDFSQVLNAGLTQARVEHLHSCKILEFRVDMDLERNCFTVFHVLEAMEQDLGTELETRKQPTKEEEVKCFLQETSSALAYAHAKQVTHGDVKPGNIFVDAEGHFKVGNFGSPYQQTCLVSAQGTTPYLSPQFREVVMGQRKQYDPYKHDVFGLGMTAMSLATHSVFVQPWSVQVLQHLVSAIAGTYSQPLRHLLSSMLAGEEHLRPTMQEVCALFNYRPAERQSQVVASSAPVSEADPLFKSLACVRYREVMLYDCETQRISRHPLSVDFGWHSACVQLGEFTLLCVGSQEDYAAVYEVLLSPCQLHSLPPLTAPRRAPGIAQVATRIYVFGGDDLRTCEKMELPDKHWHQLREQMAKPHSFFTPCQHNSLLYLASLNIPGERAVETFNPLAETFHLLSVKLPESLQLCWNTVSFVVNEELFLLTNNMQLGRWRVEAEAEFRVCKTDRITSCCQKPLVLGSLVLIACGTEIQQFSLVTCTFATPIA